MGPHHVGLFRYAVISLDLEEKGATGNETGKSRHPLQCVFTGKPTEKGSVFILENRWEKAVCFYWETNGKRDRWICPVPEVDGLSTEDYTCLTVVLTKNRHLTPSTQQAERSWLKSRARSESVPVNFPETDKV
jgi:hypothetical protein